MALGGGTGDVESSAIQKVEEIREKVKKSQGDVVLCVRNLITGIQRSHYDFSDYRAGYFETGVISGNLRNSNEFQSINVFSLSNLDLEHQIKNDYSFISTNEIPIKNKLSKGFLPGLLDFSFSNSNLEEACDGVIAFSYDEFSKSKGVLDFFIRHEKQFPSLESINIHVGEEEIRESFSGKTKPQKVDNFFKLMKTSGEIEKRVEEYRFKKRNASAEEIIISVSHLLDLDRKVKNLEKSVLNSRLHIYWDQGDTFEEWAPYEQQVKGYESINTGISAIIKQIEEKLEKSEEIGVNELAYFMGECLGFPVKIHSHDYLENLNQKILPDIKERIKKLNSHLKEQREKARN